MCSPGRSVTGEHGCIPTVIGVDWPQARYDTGHACVVGWRGVQSASLSRLWFVKRCEEQLMGTEKNQANVAPIPAPPVTPAVPGPPTLVGGGVALSPSSGRGKKMMLIGILVGVLIVLVIAGVVAIKVA